MFDIGPVYRAAQHFIDDGGDSVGYNKITAKQKQLYHDYQLILYDLNVGDQYALKAELEK